MAKLDFLKALGVDSFWSLEKDVTHRLGWSTSGLLMYLLFKYNSYKKHDKLIIDIDGFGWFYRTTEQIAMDIPHTYEMQKTDLKKLKKLKLINTKLMGAPAKKHFTINENEVFDFFDKCKAENREKYNKNNKKKSHKPTNNKGSSRIRETLKLDKGKPLNKNKGKRDTSQRENGELLYININEVNTKKINNKIDILEYYHTLYDLQANQENRLYNSPNDIQNDLEEIINWWNNQDENKITKHKITSTKTYFDITSKLFNLLIGRHLLETKENKPYKNLQDFYTRLEIKESVIQIEYTVDDIKLILKDIIENHPKKSKHKLNLNSILWNGHSEANKQFSLFLYHAAELAVDEVFKKIAKRFSKYLGKEETEQAILNNALEFENLCSRENIEASYFLEVMKWWNSAKEDKYTPKIYKGFDFCDKWEKLEAGIKRGEKSNKANGFKGKINRTKYNTGNI